MCEKEQQNVSWLCPGPPMYHPTTPTISRKKLHGTVQSKTHDEGGPQWAAEEQPKIAAREHRPIRDPAPCPHVPMSPQHSQTHKLPVRTSADSTRLMISRTNLPNRDPQLHASHTQSPTLAAPTSPNSRSLSCVAALHSHTRCALEKSSPQSGQGAHSDGCQGTPKAPR